MHDRVGHVTAHVIPGFRSTQTPQHVGFWGVRMLGWIGSVMAKASGTYGVNPCVFVVLYVLSVVPFYYGIFVMLRRARRQSPSVVATGVAVNRSAWALPYLYVLAFGKNLPPLMAWLVVA